MIRFGIAMVAVVACLPKPPPPEKVQSVIGPIIGKTVRGNEYILTVGVGTDHGVATSWRGAITSGTGQRVVPKGEVVILRVSKNASRSTCR